MSSVQVKNSNITVRSPSHNLPQSIWLFLNNIDSLVAIECFANA